MLVENWFSLKWHGSVKTEKPCCANGFVGFTVCGVGISNVPSGSLRFNRARATGLMLDPSDLIAAPPCAPVMPPNIWPSPVGVRSFVSGGWLRLAAQAVLD